MTIFLPGSLSDSLLRPLKPLSTLCPFAFLFTDIFGDNRMLWHILMLCYIIHQILTLKQLQIIPLLGFPIVYTIFFRTERIIILTRAAIPCNVIDKAMGMSRANTTHNSRPMAGHSQSGASSSSPSPSSFAISSRATKWLSV